MVLSFLYGRNNWNWQRCIISLVVNGCCLSTIKKKKKKKTYLPHFSIENSTNRRKKEGEADAGYETEYDPIKWLYLREVMHYQH